jgi:phosphatidylserine/phosphatidylglycerophosphate/cardiolipin synthase-like enzyme
VEIVSDEAMWTNFVHAKTILIDDERYIISTANLWYTWFWRNREYRFVWQQASVAQSLSTLFNKDLVGEPLLHTDIHPALLVCPLNCREKIIDAIWNANTSIHIQTQYIQDEEVVRVLKKKQTQWLDIRVLVWEYQDDGWLEDLWTGVLIMDHVYVHAKNILVDGQILLMWSMNLSSNALDNNREIWIIIDDPKAIKNFSRQFENDRKTTNLSK